ncbi:isochorismatase domain-containing protein 2-like [Oncorhynchus tshawytscha]|uniref:isochorismatase domain-containing protein 2-like n=1 Tax=Oncorhynchus tshawytscha TaxID=74940 RepID=UPI001C3D3FA2|nr:isochorismatase domain-containing protein 2-like [Oncorhynchus tshawytscha]
MARIGRLSTKGSVLLLCDMQEKFRPNIFQFTNMVSNAARLLQCTTFDLLEKGMEVHIVADAVSSRSQTDRLFALSRLRQSGAFLTTTEAVLLQHVQDAKHPNFREIQKLLVQPSPDTALLAFFSSL